MCFYEQYRYICGDWKWGNFRQHCNHEYRSGETCGMRLISNTTLLADACKNCEKINRKLSKRAFEVERVERWMKECRRTEGVKRTASIEKSMETIKALDKEIEGLRHLVREKRNAVTARR